MLVVCRKEFIGSRYYEISLDTDDLSDEDYAEFRRLWDSDPSNAKHEAKMFLVRHVRPFSTWD